MSFTMPVIGGELAAESADRIAEMAGIDLKGQTPNTIGGSFTTYPKQKIGGEILDVVLSPNPEAKGNFYEIRVARP